MTPMESTNNNQNNSNNQSFSLPPVLPQNIEINRPSNDVLSEIPSLSSSNISIIRRSSGQPPADLVQKYISQLIYGCHNEACTNPYCASNPQCSISSNQEIASFATSLARNGTKHLCDIFGRYVASEQSQGSTPNVSPNRSFKEVTPFNDIGISAERFSSLIQESTTTKDWSKCMQVIYSVFSDIDKLNNCFRTESGQLSVEETQRFYEELTHKCPSSVVSCLMTAVACLLDRVKISGTERSDKLSLETIAFLLVNPVLFDASFHSVVMVRLCDVIANYVNDSQKETLGLLIIGYVVNSIAGLKNRITANLKEITPIFLIEIKSVAFEGRDKFNIMFLKIIGVLQHFIAIRIDLLANQNGGTFSLNSDEPICNAVKVLSILNNINDKLECVHFSEFYNYAINDRLEIKDDFPLWKAKKGFSFCNYPFILNAAVKTDILKIESMIQMRHELQDSFFRAMFVGVNSPYLVIEVRRDNIVRDALYQIEDKRPQDFKKQLKIQFVGEEAVDEGGVQKEFFQLAIREIFDEKYSMFRKSDDSNLYWFSHQPESDSQYLEEIRLVGILLGLAIYNGVILDIHFPLALYKKLLGYTVDLNDLISLEPSLGKSLKHLLSYSGNVKEDFSRNFQIDINVLDEIKTYDLVKGGERILLTKENRVEFVDRYVNFILNVSVEDAFYNFKAGFDSVCGDSAISLFKPGELELLLCGGNDLDFEALKEVTTYDGGYSLDADIIKNFWDIVLHFNDSQKKRLLFFSTGSDRVPIGGLSKLNFVVTKNGPDSDRLPSSHTCFNVLMLPEYKSKEKLREKLLTAIQNSEGFGMI